MGPFAGSTLLRRGCQSLAVLLLTSSLQSSFALDITCSSRFYKQQKKLVFECNANDYFTRCAISHYHNSCTYKWPQYKTYSGSVTKDFCYSALDSRVDFASTPYKANYNCTMVVLDVSSQDSGQWLIRLKDYRPPYAWAEHRFNNITTKENHDVDDGPDQDEPDIPETTDCFMGDTSFNGHDLYPNRVSATSTPENCQDLCIKDEECSFWDWVDPLAKVVRVDSRGKCFLKKSQAVGGFKRAIGIVTGPKYCPGCYKTGHGYTSHDSIPYSGSKPQNAYTCQMKCKKVQQCEHFSFINRVSFKGCFLRKAGAVQNEAYNGIIGPKICPKATWSAWSHWTGCNVSCGPGSRYRRRVCQKSHSDGECGSSRHTKDEDRDTEECSVATPCADSASGSDEQKGTEDVLDDFGEDGFAVGIGIGVVAVVLLAVILVGFLVMRHKSEKGGGGGGLFRGRKLTADNTFFQISFKQKSTAIPIRYFRQGYNQVWMKKYDEAFPIREWMRDGRIPAKDEYNRLTNVDYRTNVLTKSKAEAARVNRTFGSGLNRYANILPYDDSRVKLRQESADDSDYVNASWITTAGSRRFIAAQGPLLETVPHFLQMIQENQVPVVVALTKLTEKDTDGISVVKCEKYWGKSKFGSANLKTLSEEPDPNVPGLVRRRLEVSALPRKRPHTFVQLHYTEWPDFGVPSSPKPLVDIVQSLRDGGSGSGTGSPAILVHCSAGVGRTGTLLALFKIVEEIDAGVEEVDVFETVLALRGERVLMVQKPAQYKYLYECIDDYLRRIHGADDDMESHYIYSST